MSQTAPLRISPAALRAAGADLEACVAAALDRLHAWERCREPGADSAIEHVACGYGVGALMSIVLEGLIRQGPDGLVVARDLLKRLCASEAPKDLRIAAMFRNWQAHINAVFKGELPHPGTAEHSCEQAPFSDR